MEELAAAAEAAGVTTLAVTEHYPLSKAFDPRDYLSMPAARVGEYLAAIDEARERHPGLEIVAGCELDWLGADDDRTIGEDDLAPFQLVLGSVHFVDAWPFDDPSQRGRWDEPGAPDAIWRRYFELWCDAVSSDAPSHVMSHPDLAKKFAYYPTYDVAPLYEQVAEACAAAGRMVEVNTSGCYYACKEMFPAPALLAGSAARACRAPWAPTRTIPSTWRATWRRPTASCTNAVTNGNGSHRHGRPARDRPHRVKQTVGDVREGR